MQSESQREFSDVLDTYNVSLAHFKPDEWKKVVTSHAQGKKALVAPDISCLSVVVTNVHFL